MSNLGFHHAMRAAGIEVLTTAVGDRYVLEALRAKDLSLGGEQSGHIVFNDIATTGDGLLTALHVMARMAETGARAGRAGRGRAPAAADADQRAGEPTATPSRPRRTSPPPSPTPRPSSATAAACCCARRAPSSWCG